MAYTINLTDGAVFATIADGTINTSSSMTLVGKNYAGYGEFLDENFIHLLENGSNTTAPSAPLTGQLWWDKTNNLLKVYNGSIFKTISAATASSTAPTSNVTGDLWYDTTNQQLKVYTGSSFIVVGPAYTSSEGTAGAIPGTVNDAGGSPHFITSLFVNNQQIAIVSVDSAFTPSAPTNTNFPTIYPGITVTKSASSTLAGNVTNTGNLTLSAGGTTTVNVTSTGANIAGYLTGTGNITGGNLLSGGTAVVTGTIVGGNLGTGGTITATGNITGGNIITAGSPLGGSQPTRVQYNDLKTLSDFMKEKFNYTTGPWEGYSNTNSSKKFLVRVDWNINDKHKLTARYVHHNSDAEINISNSQSAGAGNRTTQFNFERNFGVINKIYKIDRITELFKILFGHLNT